MKTKKILLSILIVLFVAIGIDLASSEAQAYETYGKFNYTVANKKVTIVGTDLSISGDVTVPSKIDGYSVVAIGDYAFLSRDKIKSITVPSSVKTIGSDAFNGCTALTKVTLPEKMTSIGSGAFYSCSKLTSIKIPKGVDCIGSGTFSGCTALKSVTVPDSVTSIGYNAFKGCDSLKSVTIPAAVTEIEATAFCYCNALTSIKVSSDNATFCSVDGVLFNKAKTDLICYPSDKAVTSYTIPSTVTKIGIYSFYGCDNLESVIIPDSVLTIYAEAFFDCDKLKAVNISDKVYSLSSSSFTDCNSLTSINVSPDNRYYSSLDGVLFDKRQTYLYTYPAGKTNESYTIPSTVTTVSVSAFRNCDNLTSLTIPDSVTTSGNSAFMDCSKLSTVNIGSGLSVISSNSFTNCDSLTEITIPTNITKIGSNAFEDCDSLKSIKIPDTVKSVEAWAFMDCDKLSKISIGSGITEIGFYVFRNCDSLKSVTIPDNITKISGGAFADCDSLEKVVIPKSVTTIEYTAFNNSDGVTIYCDKGSAAEAYAKAQKINYADRNHTHKYKTKVTDATLTKNGKKVTTCEGCSYKKTTTIYYPKTFSFKETVYNGKTQKPTLTVKDSNGKTVSSKNYTVTYPEKSKSVGKYTVTVKFKGNYTGAKKVSYTINPKPTGKITASQTDTTITAKWSKVTGATGYKLYLYRGSSLIKEATVSSKTLSYKFTGLKSGYKHTVKVKAYASADGTNIYSESKSLATATAPATPSITSLKAGSDSATVKWSNVSGESGYQVYYATSKDGKYTKGAQVKADDASEAIEGLTKGKTYYFKVRAYKKTDSGTVFSAWSNVKSVKVK